VLGENRGRTESSTASQNSPVHRKRNEKGDCLRRKKTRGNSNQTTPREREKRMRIDKKNGFGIQNLNEGSKLS